MSSSSAGSNSLVSWSFAAAGVLAGVGAGYALGVASTNWSVAAHSAATSGRSTASSTRISGPPTTNTRTLDTNTSSNNMVAAIVELTAEVKETHRGFFSNI